LTRTEASDVVSAEAPQARIDFGHDRLARQAVKAGKARYIGASSMHAWQFARALGIVERHGWTRLAFSALPDTDEATEAKPGLEHLGAGEPECGQTDQDPKNSNPAPFRI
jgi:aryl-alcohol dehydrogenase-like predicted oxidoreductase